MVWESTSSILLFVSLNLAADDWRVVGAASTVGGPCRLLFLGYAISVASLVGVVVAVYPGEHRHRVLAKLPGPPFGRCRGYQGHDYAQTQQKN